MSGVLDLARPGDLPSAADGGDPARASTFARVAAKLVAISLGLIFGPVANAGAQAPDAGSPTRRHPATGHGDAPGASRGSRRGPGPGNDRVGGTRQGVEYRSGVAWRAG